MPNDTIQFGCYVPNKEESFAGYLENGQMKYKTEPQHDIWDEAQPADVFGIVFKQKSIVYPERYRYFIGSKIRPKFIEKMAYEQDGATYELAE